MFQADLLPSILSALSELFPLIACYEVRLLLDVVSRYLQNSLLQGLSQQQLGELYLFDYESLLYCCCAYSLKERGKGAPLKYGLISTTLFFFLILSIVLLKSIEVQCKE